MIHCIQNAAIAFTVLGAFAHGMNALDAGTLVIAAGKVSGIAGKEVVVPITVKGVKEIKGLGAMAVRLSYDPQVLTFKSIAKGPVLPNALVQKNLDENTDPGKVAFGFVCVLKDAKRKEFGSVSDDGVVLKLTFLVNPKAMVGAKTVLKLDNCQATNAEDQQADVELQLGELTVNDAKPPSSK